jgi:hypothetical protein
MHVDRENINPSLDDDDDDNNDKLGEGLLFLRIYGRYI